MCKDWVDAVDMFKNVVMVVMVWAVLVEEVVWERFVRVRWWSFGWLCIAVEYVMGFVRIAVYASWCMLCIWWVCGDGSAHAFGSDGVGILSVEFTDKFFRVGGKFGRFPRGVVIPDPLDEVFKLVFL